jgi:hypothetical protein
MLYFMVTRQLSGYQQEYIAHFMEQLDARRFVALKIKDDYNKERLGPIVYRIFEEEEATAKALLGLVNQNKKTFLERQVYDYDTMSKDQAAVHKPQVGRSIRFFSQGVPKSDGDAEKDSD